MNEQHVGSRFDDFLAEDNLLEETSATAIKRVVAWQIAEEMKKQNLTQADLAARMHTTSTALSPLLGETDTSPTLATLASAAAALGKTVRVELISAP